MKKYLFVCTGNTCRSPMAEGIFNQLAKEKGLDFFAKSAGISAIPGEPVSKNAQSACMQIGVDISSHKATQLTNDLFYEADAVVPLTETHRLIMQDAFKDTKKILAPLNVFDPFGKSEEEYCRCRDIILDKIKELVDENCQS